MEGHQHLWEEVDFTVFDDYDEDGNRTLNLPDELPFDDAVCRFCGNNIGAYLDESEDSYGRERATVGIRPTYHCVRCRRYVCEDCTDPVNHDGVIMVAGDTYHVTMQIPGQWVKPRCATMKWMGANDGGRTLVFDLRPIAGTQSVNQQHVIRVAKSSQPLHEPRVVP